MGRFKEAISGKKCISVVAEIKRRSPSHGAFPAYPVAELIQAYERGGAAAISVVTEPNMFGGSLELLKAVRRATNLPLLRKDFISKKGDVEQSAEAGANAVLLIASLLTYHEIRELSRAAADFGIDVVLEIHTEQDFLKIADQRDAIIGINNRNLQTMQTDVNHAAKFLARIAPSRTILVESAFQNAHELAPYRRRADAVLIGTTFLTAPYPEHALASFTAASL